MGAIEGLEKILVPADQIRGHCLQFEVFDTQRRLLVGPRERLEGIGPSPFLAEPAALGEFARHLGYPFLRWTSFNVAHLRTPIEGEIIRFEFSMRITA